MLTSHRRLLKDGTRPASPLARSSGTPPPAQPPQAIVLPPAPPRVRSDPPTPHHRPLPRHTPRSRPISSRTLDIPVGSPLPPLHLAGPATAIPYENLAIPQSLNRPIHRPMIPGSYAFPSLSIIVRSAHSSRAYTPLLRTLQEYRAQGSARLAKHHAGNRNIIHHHPRYADLRPPPQTGGYNKPSLLTGARWARRSGLDAEPRKHPPHQRDVTATKRPERRRPRSPMAVPRLYFFFFLCVLLKNSCSAPHALHGLQHGAEKVLLRERPFELTVSLITILGTAITWYCRDSSGTRRPRCTRP